MPRGGQAVGAPSSAKPVGSECSAARPSRAEAMAASSSAAFTSAAPTARPPTFAAADRRCDAMRPPVRLTITPSARTPAMRSAAATAQRIEVSAASMSSTRPALTPREGWRPMPMILTRCVRPSETSSGATGVSLAIRQTIFEAPTSSAQT